MLKIKKL